MIAETPTAADAVGVLRYESTIMHMQFALVFYNGKVYSAESENP